MLNWTEIIIAIVALYGALLSTYTLLANKREKQRRIRVKLTWGLITLGPNPAGVFFLSASNPGNRTVTLKSCHLLLPNGKNFLMPHMTGNITFPYDLEEGKSCQVWFPIVDVVQALMDEGYRHEVKITAVYTDALDTVHKSKEFSGNLADWSKAV